MKPDGEGGRDRESHTCENLTAKVCPGRVTEYGDRFSCCRSWGGIPASVDLSQFWEQMGDFGHGFRWAARLGVGVVVLKESLGLGEDLREDEARGGETDGRGKPWAGFGHRGLCSTEGGFEAK